MFRSLSHCVLKQTKSNKNDQPTALENICPLSTVPMSTGFMLTAFFYRWYFKLWSGVHFSRKAASVTSVSSAGPWSHCPWSGSSPCPSPSSSLKQIVAVGGLKCAVSLRAAGHLPLNPSCALKTWSRVCWGPDWRPDWGPDRGPDWAPWACWTSSRPSETEPTSFWMRKMWWQTSWGSWRRRRGLRRRSLQVVRECLSCCPVACLRRVVYRGSNNPSASSCCLQTRICQAQPYCALIDWSIDWSSDSPPCSRWRHHW